MEKIAQNELIKRIANETGAEMKAVKIILFNAARQISEAAEDGIAVVFPGLGTFKPVDRAARTCRNPSTGAAIDVPAKRVLTFKKDI